MRYGPALLVAVAAWGGARPERSAVPAAGGDGTVHAAASVADAGDGRRCTRIVTASPPGTGRYTCPLETPAEGDGRPVTLTSRGWSRPITCPYGHEGGGGWPRMCDSDAGGVALEAWLPPAPHRPPEHPNPRLDNYSPTWPSSEPPTDLVIAMIRAGIVDYGVNVFKDGRFTSSP